MTSTNIFQGMSEGRNSSRVLRPPGGGPTDVLGLGGGNEIQQPKKSNPRNVSSITEGTNTLSPTEPQKPITPVVNEPTPAPAAPAPAKTEPAPASSAPPPQAPQRVRVPPGGFSSGLW